MSFEAFKFSGKSNDVPNNQGRDMLSNGKVLYKQLPAAGQIRRTPFPKWSSLPLSLNDMPLIYKNVWTNVRLNTNSAFCDTSKLHPILLSSGVGNDVLASVWSFVNRTSPGQLTCQELCVALSMIAMVQNRVSNSLPDVSNQSAPLIPKLMLPQNSLHSNCPTGSQSSSQSLDDISLLMLDDSSQPSVCNNQPSSLDTHHATTCSTSDRYDVFRELSSTPDFPRSETNSTAGPNDCNTVWCKCLKVCKNLLQKSFNALIVNHDEESVIEALKSSPGQDFIEDLHEVYLIAKRIGAAYNRISLKDHLIDLQSDLTDIEMIWKPLVLLFGKVKHTNPLLNTPSQSSGPTCGICFVSDDSLIVLVNNKSYHKSCANLWLTFLSEQLPDHQLS